MQFIISFVVTVILANTALWLVYRRQVKRQEQEQAARLTNCYAYVDELQQRAERYRVAMLSEALANKTKTEPVVKVYPIQRSGAYWVIETHLN